MSEISKTDKLILQTLSKITGYASGLAIGAAYEDFNKEALIKSLNEISRIAGNALDEITKDWK
jgi:hypothetical protein